MRGRIHPTSRDQNPWIEVVNDDGDTVGYIHERDAYLSGIEILEVRPIRRYLEDSYVRYHAHLAYERGLLTKGQDLNDVQVAMLATRMRVERDKEEALHERDLAENMAINNPMMYKAFTDRRQKEREREAMADMVQERIPNSMEEFMDALKAFSTMSGDEVSEDEFEDEDEFSFIPPELLDGMTE